MSDEKPFGKMIYIVKRRLCEGVKNTCLSYGGVDWVKKPISDYFRLTKTTCHKPVKMSDQLNLKCTFNDILI